MEGQLWKLIVRVVDQLDKRRKRAAEGFGDDEIVKVYFWSSIHDRTVNWACKKENWPLHARRKKLPSDSTISRRLRTPSVIALLKALEKRVTKPSRPGLFWMMDGKPLVIGGCSKDRQAGYGKAASSMAKGYKLHVLVGSDGSLGDWRVAPMNKDERVIAKRLLKTADIQGYVVADANYDSNYLHQICDVRGNRQLLTPRRYGSGRQLGHREQADGRLRSIAMLEWPQPEFGKQLMRDRVEIERYFSKLTCWAGGLTHLPPWVRTHRRVHRWVQSKLVLSALRQSFNQSTYVH